VTIEDRERIRRRKRMKRNLMRTMRTILLMPARVPKVRGQALAIAVKACEVAGITFVVLLIISMLNPGGAMTFLRTVSAIAFFSLFFFIKIEEYQVLLENYSFN